MKFFKNLQIKFLLIAILLFQPNVFMASQNNKSDSSVGTAVAVAAGSAAVGFGLYNIFNTFCASSDRLVNDACKELIIAKNYKRQLEILEEEYEELSSVERKQEVYEFNEDLAQRLSSSTANKVIDYQYCKSLNQLIKNLKFYQTKLPKRVRKLQRDRNVDKYKDVISDMQELIGKINQLIPKLEILNKYIDVHRRYFELDEVYELVTIKFAKELKLLSSDESKLVSKLKKHIRAKYGSSTSYPCIEYVRVLNVEIDNLNRYINRTSNKYANLIDDSKELKSDLFEIKSMIANDREYFSEQRDLEKVQAQERLANSMFWLGTAAGISTAIVSKPKEEVIIIEEEPATEVTVVSDDVQVEVIEEV